MPIAPPFSPPYSQPFRRAYEPKRKTQSRFPFRRAAAVPSDHRVAVGSALPATILLTFLSILLAACASMAPAPSPWTGPAAAAAVQTEPWNFTAGRRSTPGHVIETDHYAIHTTVTDRDFQQSLAQLMEAAWQQYHALTPDVTPSDWPMVCYLFAARSEWAAFTADRTGADAAVYLQISRGGYTVHDWFVSYYLGDINTYSVAAHEGWHQFVARNFRTRPPPFLEEGIATLFENVRWSAGLPRWNLASNPHRQQSLTRAFETHDLFPLDKLITMHAGDIVAMPAGKIDAFYAQDWAFALFLLDGDHGAHRAALQRLLADTAHGRAYLPSEMPHSVLPDAWQPSSVRPLLLRYLGQNWPTIDAEFTAFEHHLADGSTDGFLAQ